ncbi:MAG: porin [Myxococcota bacterium]
MLLSADVGGAFGGGDDDGFRLADARVAFDGRVGDEWSFLLQTDAVRGEDFLLDLRLTYQPFTALRVQAGLFKVPLGAEFLIPAVDIDVLQRSLASDAVVPGRAIGAEIGGRLGDRETEGEPGRGGPILPRRGFQ